VKVRKEKEKKETNKIDMELTAEYNYTDCSNYKYRQSKDIGIHKQS